MPNTFTNSTTISNICATGGNCLSSLSCGSSPVLPPTGNNLLYLLFLLLLIPGVIVVAALIAIPVILIIIKSKHTGVSGARTAFGTDLGV
jgi:hypothetical protein